MADVLQTLAEAPGPAALPAGEEERKARSRIAQLLIQQGVSPEPIQHWTQGLAKLAQAGFGGWDMSQLAKEERDQRAQFQKLMDQDPRLSTGGASEAPSRTAAALAGVGPTVENTAATYGAAPASIRNNNPGAMWPGASSAAYGSTGSQNVAGNNKIATFSDPVAGAAAQFDLLKRNYSGMSMADAIKKWSGGNNVDAYTAGVSKATGLLPDTMITPEFLSSPQGISLARAMARHEAGRDYPLTPEQWAQAQTRAFAGGVPAAATATGAVPQQAPPVPGAPPPYAPTAAAAAPVSTAAQASASPAAPQAAAPAQASRVPTQMTPEMALHIRKLQATGRPEALIQAEKLKQQFGGPTKYDVKVAGDKIIKTDEFGNVTTVGDANKQPDALDIAKAVMANPTEYGYSGKDDPRLQRDVQYRISGLQTPGQSVRDQADAALLKEVQEHYGKALGLKPALQTARAAIEKSPEGMVGQMSARWARLASGLGLPIPEGANEAQLIQSITTQLAPLYRQAGATSDMEMKLYSQAAPNLGDSKQANLMKINLFEKLMDRSGQITDTVRRYAGTDKLYDELAKIDKPIFSEQERKNLEAGLTPEGTQPNNTFKIPKLDKVGADWVEIGGAKVRRIPSTPGAQ